MGCSSSKRFVINKDFPGQDAQSVKDMVELGFSKENIDSLYNCFAKFDLENSGDMDIAEFTERLNIGITKISKGVFGDLDVNQDRSVDFREVYENLK